MEYLFQILDNSWESSLDEFKVTLSLICNLLMKSKNTRRFDASILVGAVHTCWCILEEKRRLLTYVCNMIKSPPIMAE